MTLHLYSIHRLNLNCSGVVTRHLVFVQGLYLVQFWVEDMFYGFVSSITYLAQVVVYLEKHSHLQRPNEGRLQCVKLLEYLVQLEC